MNLHPQRLGSSLEARQPGCLATLHPGQWSRQPSACSAPHHSYKMKAVKSATQKMIKPDCQLEVPWDDPGLLVVPCCITSQFQDLCREILHHRSHVDWSSSTHSLGIISFPRGYEHENHNQNTRYLRSLWMRPTGNWRPALLDLDFTLVLVLPPLPRPDIFQMSIKV